MSSPCSSSSTETRSLLTMSVAFSSTKAIMKVKATAPISPSKWAINNPVWPKNRPSVVTTSLMVWVAKTPVRIMPTIPPTPWLGNTSRVSSTPARVRHSTTSQLMTEATKTNISECLKITKPEDGVMAQPTTDTQKQNQKKH